MVSVLVLRGRPLGLFTRPSVPSPKSLEFRCVQNGSSASREKGAYLNRYVTDEQRSSRPIFNATLRAAAKLKGFRRRYTRLLRCEEPTKSSLILASLATAAKIPGETPSLSLSRTPSPQYSITPILHVAVRTEP